MNVPLLEGLPDWLTTLLYSRWLYAVLGGVFFVIFVCGVVRLFRRNEGTPGAAQADAPTDSTFDYVHLLAAVGKPNGRARNVLLAAGSLNDLPITIPVNAGVQLAGRCKCLLIDLDTRRDAVARVFEITPDLCPAARTPVPTPIENLDIWPAHYFSRLRQMDLKTLLTASQQNYDVILLNAPYLSTHPDRRQIVRCADSAVLFAKDKKTAETLGLLLKSGSCKTIKTLALSGRLLD
jgi:hypothetical protein